MMKFKVFFHTVKNNDLYFQDKSGENYDAWAGFYSKEIQAGDIETALKKAAAIATPNWRCIAFEEFKGCNERGQKEYKTHCIYNPKYEIE